MLLNSLCSISINLGSRYVPIQSSLNYNKLVSVQYKSLLFYAADASFIWDFFNHFLMLYGYIAAIRNVKFLCPGFSICHVTWNIQSKNIIFNLLNLEDAKVLHHSALWHSHSEVNIYGIDFLWVFSWTWFQKLWYVSFSFGRFTSITDAIYSLNYTIIVITCLGLVWKALAPRMKLDSCPEQGEHQANNSSRFPWVPIHMTYLITK